MGDSTEGSDQGTDVRTFLIADIRGYTKYTQEHGDQAAAELATTFAELVREVVEARQGFLLEVRGDEALAVFVSARQALRAAVELQARLGDSDLARGIGVGLDSGEAIPVGEGYRGGALNLAARLCAQAKAGEILASESVIHLAAKVEGLAYVDPRTFKLKGYDEPVRAVEVVPADQARKYNVRRRFGRRTGRLARRRGIRVAAALFVILALVAILLPRILGGGASAVLASDPAGMAILDVKSGHQITFIPQSTVMTPVEATYADGHFWVTNLDPLSFVEIDPKTGAVVRQIASPVPDANGLAVNGNDMWLPEGQHPAIVHWDISHQVANTLTLYPRPKDLGGLSGGLFADGSLWVGGGGRLLRIDPGTGHVLHTITNLPDAGPLAYGDGSIWTLWGFPNSGLARIDVKTDTVVHAKLPATPGGFFPYVAAGGGSGWTADESKGVVYKVGPQGGLVNTYSTGEGARVVSFADAALWVGNQDAGTVTGINALTGDQTTFRFEHPVQAVAAGSGSVLVLLSPGRTYEDRINALQGNVARLLAPAYQLENDDPATAASQLAFEVEYATCAKLLNYPDLPSPAGWRLRPEVAASMPDLSADRRTYTFTVQPGYRFSPPSNQQVTAETYRYSIERALSPKLGDQAPGSLVITDIRGEQAFVAGKVDHISGLKAQGHKLIVTLTKPSPDFLERLATPYFCPVPTDTPFSAQGAAIQGNGTDMVPSAGPYYIADHLNGEYVILKRNPNYSGLRAHVLDAIALREGIDPGQAVGLVQKGTWDGITNMGDPILYPDGEVAQQWGPGGTSTSKGTRWYYAVPSGFARYVLFNAGRRLFSDRRVREAVAYALNRPALAEAWGKNVLGGQGGALPADQLVPPDLQGFQGPGVFPSGGPDLAKAKALMHGRRATASLVVSRTNLGQIAQAQEVKNDLAPIGIDVRIVKVDDSVVAISTPGAPYDMKVGGNSTDFLDSANYVTGLFVGVPPDYTPALPSDWQPLAMRAAVMRLANVRSLPVALSLLNGPIAKDVPMTGTDYTTIGAFLGPHLGCRVFPPASFGVDLAALCLTGS